jgi:hypothetical protein
MQRKISAEQCKRIRDLDTTNLRRQCARFVLDHAQEIAAARPEIPRALNDRAADIWEPLFVLADLAGGPWPELSRDGAVALAAAAEETNAVSSLLLDILILFAAQKADRLFTRDLLHGLTSRFKDRPWMADCNGKSITDIWLSNQLRPYGIRPKTVWINNDHAKGYLAADFHDAGRRYISKTDIDQLIGTPDPPPQEQS